MPKSNRSRTSWDEVVELVEQRVTKGRTWKNIRASIFPHQSVSTPRSRYIHYHKHSSGDTSQQERGEPVVPLPLEQKYTCAICRFSFSIRDILNDHIKASHSTILDISLTSLINPCMQCNQSFHSRSVLEQHQDLKHQVKCKGTRRSLWIQ